MILDDLKDRALEALQAAKSKLEENDTYLGLKEKFDSLSPVLQKTIQGFASFVILYALFQIPMSYYSGGSENLALFEENRDLILDLYRVKRRALLAPQAPTPISAPDLESRARNALVAARVQADQIKSVSFFDNQGPQSSDFIPKSVEQKGVEVRVANLNVNQLVEVGHALSTLADSVKMIGLEIKPGTQAGSYFDASFKLVSFSVASALSGADSKLSPGSKKSSRKGP